MDRSALGAAVSVSVAELFAGLVSVVPTGTATAAVLARLPVALDATFAIIVKVAVPPFNRLTVVLILPLPDAGQVELEDATQVQVALVMLAGKVSVTVAPVTSLGPL